MGSSAEVAEHNGIDGQPVPSGWLKIKGILVPSIATAEQAVRTLLMLVGEDPDRNGLKDTPNRVVRALIEMTAGYSHDPKEILATVFEQPYDELIILRDVPFTSQCEHHMLVFEGTVDIGYIPGSKGIVGLSKLARLVDCFAKRLQVQEKLTKQIAEAIGEHLEAKGVAVVVRASHSCMSCRGIKKSGAVMTTSVMTGVMRDKPEARAEFLALCRG